MQWGRDYKRFPLVNKDLVNLFESLPHVLANSRENNANKPYMNYFIKWQKWANQFPEVNPTPTEEIYGILYMLSLFQNNKSYPVIRMLYYAIKYLNVLNRELFPLFHRNSANIKWLTST